MTRTIFLISAACMLSNCVSIGPSDEVANVDLDKLALICTREVPTGSHMPVKICRSQQQIEQEREAARTVIRRTED